MTASFDLDTDLPPEGATVTGVAVTAVAVREWTYSRGQWTSDDGCGRPELVARLFTPAGRAITQLWLREGA
jgi:hypothetical protein